MRQSDHEGRIRLRDAKHHGVPFVEHSRLWEVREDSNVDASGDESEGQSLLHPTFVSATVIGSHRGKYSSRRR
jgi:hypothetical protein